MKAIPGKEISCLYDNFGPVRVLDDGIKRYLTFGAGDEQSCMLKDNPALLQYDYNRTMWLVMLFCQPLQVTVFGLGGGSLVNCLLKHLSDIQLTVVELRETVINTAKRFFNVPNDPRLTIHHDDALQYIQRMENASCDLLFSDLFMAEGAEGRQLTRQFLDHSERILAKDGWLVINCLFEYRTQPVIDDLFGRVYQTVYECVTDDGNWVVIAGKHAVQDNEKQLFALATQWSQTVGFSLKPHLKRVLMWQQDYKQ